MHATAVFDGERWGNRVIPFSFSACCFCILWMVGGSVFSLFVGYDHDDIVRCLTLLLLLLFSFSFFFWNDTYISWHKCILHNLYSKCFTLLLRWRLLMLGSSYWTTKPPLITVITMHPCESTQNFIGIELSRLELLTSNFLPRPFGDNAAIYLRICSVTRPYRFVRADLGTHQFSGSPLSVICPVLAGDSVCVALETEFLRAKLVCV